MILTSSATTKPACCCACDEMETGIDFFEIDLTSALRLHRGFCHMTLQCLGIMSRSEQHNGVLPGTKSAAKR